MARHASSDGAAIRRATALATTAAVALAVLLAAAAPAAGSAGAAGTDPAFVVALSAGGGADVTLTLTYDLSTDDERAAFASLRDDPAARDELAARFRDRLARVAAAAENRTGRSMAVHHPAASVTTTDDGATGVVTLRVVWEGLAAVEGDRLVVTEPFASGFSPDRRFAVVGPEGYRVGSVAPPADERGDGRVAWAAGTALDGFEATFVDGETADGSDGGSGGDDGTPTETHLPTSPPVSGFGSTVAGVAVAAAALVAARRR